MKHTKKTAGKLLLSLLLLYLWATPVHSQNYTTLTYYEKDSLNLKLDLFLPPATQDEALIPLVIFVHGGGFAVGNRKSDHSFCKYMAKQGIAAASIDYTLYMKDKNFSCKGITSEKIKAIQIAANQLWLATYFLSDRSQEYNIDTSKIFIAGSSAGAETVLHAAFWDKKQMALFEADKLSSSSCKYAGVIAGAGAIMDLNLITGMNKIPVMMFHGTADKLVPYGTAAHHFCPPDATGWLMFFGSYAIYKHIVALGGTVSLITYKGGTHDCAGAHFNHNQKPVYNFIKKVLQDTQFQNHTIHNSKK